MIYRYLCKNCKAPRSFVVPHHDLHSHQLCKQCGASYMLVDPEHDHAVAYSRRYFKRPNKAWRQQRRTAIKLKHEGFPSVAIELGLYHGKEEDFRNTFPANSKTFGCNATPERVDDWTIERTLRRRAQRLRRWPYEFNVNERTGTFASCA